MLRSCVLYLKTVEYNSNVHLLKNYNFLMQIFRFLISILVKPNVVSLLVYKISNV